MAALFVDSGDVTRAVVSATEALAALHRAGEFADVEVRLEMRLHVEVACEGTAAIWLRADLSRLCVSDYDLQPVKTGLTNRLAVCLLARFFLLIAHLFL